MSILYVLAGLIFLYFTNRKMTMDLSRLIHRLGGNQNMLIWIWSVIFLPGTIIHELSHFLVAAATGARTGKIEIFPEFIEETLDEENKNHHVTLGSVQVARMNPIQGFLVGTAPFISGLIILIYLSPQMLSSFRSENNLLLAIQTYLFFTIANSFFPSWTDIKQTLPFVAITLIMAIFAWLFGFQFVLGSSSFITNTLDSLSGAILLSFILNLIVIGILFLANRRSR